MVNERNFAWAYCKDPRGSKGTLRYTPSWQAKSKFQSNTASLTRNQSHPNSQMLNAPPATLSPCWRFRGMFWVNFYRFQGHYFINFNHFCCQLLLRDNFVVAKGFRVQTAIAQILSRLFEDLQRFGVQKFIRPKTVQIFML